MSSSKRDTIIVSIIAIQFIVLCIVLYYRRSLSAPSEVRIPAQKVIGDKTPLLGRADAPMTLVEFGDYQCPPCANLQPRIVQLLAAHEDKLRLQFRHFPLLKIHPLAKKAALIAESARTGGMFWRVHVKLYALKAKLTDVGLDRLDIPLYKQAEQRVQDDIEIANHIGINGTPTFLLCLPDGHVFRLRSLEQVNRFL